MKAIGKDANCFTLSPTFRSPLKRMRLAYR